MEKNSVAAEQKKKKMLWMVITMTTEIYVE